MLYLILLQKYSKGYSILFQIRKSVRFGYFDIFLSLEPFKKQPFILNLFTATLKFTTENMAFRVVSGVGDYQDVGVKNKIK